MGGALKGDHAGTPGSNDQGASCRTIGFLRNVMLGREGLHRTVLLERLAALGAGRPVSFFTTGNVAFDIDLSDLPAFVSSLEVELAGIIGRHEPVYTRSLSALRRIVQSTPFDDTPFGDKVVQRVISFAREPIVAPASMPVYSRRRDACIHRIEGMEAYGVARLVNGRASGPGGLAEHVIGSKITTRSWGTVCKIVARESV
jgi:uncharacterized protein (DUF1697 family)